MTTISPERLRDGIYKRVVISRDLSWLGWGILVQFDPWGEGHFSYRPPGHVGDPLTDDMAKILDGGLIINDVSGEALINTNGMHDYVAFPQITDCGLVKVPLKFSAKERWLPPPSPGEWAPRITTYYGESGKASLQVSLQGYKLPKRWEYRDFETGLIIPVEPPYSITDPG